jgi:hypothetical protein
MRWMGHFVKGAALGSRPGTSLYQCTITWASMRLFAVLASLVLLLHLAWIVWILLGWRVTRTRPWLRVSRYPIIGSTIRQRHDGTP